MRPRLCSVAVWLPVAALLAGCGFLLPSARISKHILDPDTTCQQLAHWLDLGSLPDASTPGDLGLQYESFSVASTNRSRLAAWYVPAQQDGQLDPEPLGTILIMHGVSGTRACTLPWIVLGTINHMHVVAFDYQGFGESTGLPDVATLLDDSDAVLRWIIADESPARQQVHLVGTSLGTAPALGLVALHPRPRIQSVMLDGAWDPVAMIEVGKEYVPPLLAPFAELIGRVTFLWLPLMRDRLGGVTTPAMFITAKDDTTTPLAGARAMFELIGSASKSHWIFENRTHIQPLFKDTETYVSLAVTFWRDPPAPPDPYRDLFDPSIQIPDFTEVPETAADPGQECCIMN
ncbi:MAG: alpha/beta hydrolase [Phycisphaerae bacterium]|nr:alpha/beta hydrolase [Phycisphaerae bacterium]